MYSDFYSSDTESLLRPLALLRASTFLPFLVAILDLNPCLFLRFLFDGWNVRFIVPQIFGSAKVDKLFQTTKKLVEIKKVVLSS
jgi:hypothetical protein